MKKLILTSTIVIITIFGITAKLHAQTLPMIIQYNNPKLKKNLVDTSHNSSIIINKTSRKITDTLNTIIRNNNEQQLKNALNAYLNGPLSPAALVKSLTSKNPAGVKKTFLDSLNNLQQIKSRLHGLKNMIRNTKSLSNTDTANITKYTGEIDSIKIFHTNQFLTTIKPSEPFWILNLNTYQLDTINKYIYNQSTFSGLQSATLQSINSSTTINTEFASALFGPVRVGLGGSFQTKGDTSKDDAIKSSLQKIVANGGTVNISALIPLFVSRSQNENAHFQIFGQNNIGLTPGVDTTGATDFSKNLSFTDQVGILIHADAGSNDKGALLSLSLPCLYSISSNNLNKELGLPNYFLLKAQFGINFNGVVNLQVSGPLVSTAKQVQNAPFQISLQFSPAQIIGSKK